MSGVRTGHTKAAWLLLYRSAAWQATTQVSHALSLEYRQAVDLLRVMVRGGLVERRATSNSGRKRYEFAVTKACRVPTGVTIEELEATA